MPDKKTVAFEPASAYGTSSPSTSSAGCGGRVSERLELLDANRKNNLLTSDQTGLISGQSRQFLPNLDDPALDPTRHGESRRRRRLTLEDVRDGYPQGRLKRANGDVERV